ncbi:phosphodiesterase [Deinococcus ruber]|uniref:Phosphodiesterase n=1 Tax=Deinococcus ruber TaxID=1848197 RepID=A0A918KVH6_9DEIO|nr:phosphodiesterase [Deinococcus ruber]
MPQRLLLGSLLAMCVAHAQTLPPVKHVLLISVDGLHEQDLRLFVTSHPNSALSTLSKRGLTYSQAQSSMPSDSFPGLLALVTGGTPKSTGVYYDDSYDRTLAAPGTDCSVAGTEVVYDESIDKNPDALDAGGGLDPAKLPRDPAHGCAPVYPHSFLRVNTVFEVATAAGLPTAWADKHPAYDLIQGPSGNGVLDLYTPEINNASNPTDNVGATAAYDALKVGAVLNQIGGKTSSGAAGRVPAIFGMNFQALSVAQKTTGYADASGKPGADVATAMNFVDASLGMMVNALKAQGLFDSTLIVISAKHGQSPIDRSALKIVDSKALAAAIKAAAPAGAAQLTTDSVGLVWLKDGTQAGAVAAALSTPANMAALSIASVLSGPALRAQYGDPATDSRVPDLVIIPTKGVIYTKPTASKIAEHGGFSDDDTHVGLLISAPGLSAATITTPVRTTQVAPTLLSALGLDPNKLQAVQQEGTTILPLK